MLNEQVTRCSFLNLLLIYSSKMNKTIDPWNIIIRQLANELKIFGNVLISMSSKVI